MQLKFVSTGVKRRTTPLRIKSGFSSEDARFSAHLIIPQTMLALWGSHVWFPKQCLHYGVLTCDKGWSRLCRLRAAPRQRKIIKKTVSFYISFFNQKKCWRSSFEVPRYIFLRMLQLICLFWLTIWCGLQRQLAPKGAPKASQGVPKGFRKDCLGSRAGVIPQTVLALWGSHVW